MPLQPEIVGFVAGALTTFCLLPQAIKIIITRDTKAISLATELALTLGCSLWMIYGLLIGSPSIIIFNLITACLAATITLLKLRFG
jgi:MtN3 and saliva related transmembrane protein